VQLVPRVLTDLLNVDSVVGVSHKDLCDHVLRFFRKELRQVVLGVQDLLVQV